MRRRLLIGYLGLTVLVAIVLGTPLTLTYIKSERDELMARVERQAFQVAQGAAPRASTGDSAALQSAASAAASDGARIIVVDDQGVLLADSSSKGVTPPDRTYSTRPEIRAALDGRVARGTRGSRTLGYDLVYVAAPIVHDSQVVGAVRITYPASEVYRELLIYAVAIMALLGAVLTLAALTALRLARWSSDPLLELEESAAAVAAGDLDARADDSHGPGEVRTVARQFNTMVEHLALLIESQHAFVADASHQLRTPLAALRLRLENLEDSVSGDEVRSLHAAIGEADRLSRIITALLTLARADATSPASGELDLGAVVHRRFEQLQYLASDVGVALQASGASDTVEIAGVDDRVSQVIDNLVANAIAASEPGQEVTVHWGHAPDGGGELRVVDHGPGMSQEELAHAFDRFWRAPSATGPGSGLGLAIVERLARVDGAHVQLRSPDEGGLEAVVHYRPVTTAGN